MAQQLRAMLEAFVDGLSGRATAQGCALVTALGEHGLDADPAHLVAAVEGDAGCILQDIFGEDEVHTDVKDGFGAIVAAASRLARVTERSKYPYGFAPLADALAVGSRKRQPEAVDSGSAAAGGAKGTRRHSNSVGPEVVLEPRA